MLTRGDWSGVRILLLGIFVDEFILEGFQIGNAGAQLIGRRRWPNLTTLNICKDNLIKPTI